MSDKKEDNKEYLKFLKINDYIKIEKLNEILDYYVAGERNNKLLLYFLMLGNLYNDSLKSFVMYRGDPGSGKNVVTNAVLKLFPSNKVYMLDAATAKALNYDGALKEAEIIYLRELEKHESVIEILKGLYNADGRIFKETIQDKETKGHYVKHHELDRKGIITTFSFENIKSDIVSRSWILTPNQTYEQTKNVINFYLEKEHNLIENKIENRKMDQRCFFISKCIENLRFDYNVFIPYIKKLESLLPHTQINVRRDLAKLFNLIKIITVWNQYNRRNLVINGDKFLFAEFDDLKIALEICQDLFINLVLQIDDIKKSILDFMVEHIIITKPLKKGGTLDKQFGTTQVEVQEMEIDKKYTVTEVYEEIRTTIDVSRKTIKRKLDDLFYDGYVVRGKPSNAYVYKKMRGYDLVSGLKLNEIKEEIDALVDQSYNFYEAISEKEGIINGKE